ncbi:MAG: hypothetical protein OXN17_12475 [Candidatus Poribacteria bacterium]|nr:hypothetical protein [Candidatus Poribacteria bacterium]MDE0504480.1 hypothetical protein [Candidatus Poribacteria bacterium]
MPRHTPGTTKQPFPRRRPEVVIAPSHTKPFPVDCPELRWWFIVPKIGERALYADYSANAWELSEVNEMEVTAAASVHGMEGVEIAIQTWKTHDGWCSPPWNMYGRLTRKTAEYLAVSQVHDGKRLLYTHLDRDFDYDWGIIPRLLEDHGLFTTQTDGSIMRLHCLEGDTPSAAGVFSVTIGERHFTCLRVLELGIPLESHDTHQTVSYVTEAGRTVLVRHFCHSEKTILNHHGDPEKVVVDNDLQLVIDEVAFAHWYDSFSNVAFGF